MAHLDLRAVAAVEVRAARHEQAVLLNHMGGKGAVLCRVVRVPALHAVEPQCVQARDGLFLLGAREPLEADVLVEVRERGHAARRVDGGQGFFCGHVLVEAELAHGRVEVVVPERLRPVVEVQRDKVAHNSVAVELAERERLDLLERDVDALRAHVVDDLRDFPFLDAADPFVKLLEGGVLRIEAEADDVELAAHEVGCELHAINEVEPLLLGRSSGLLVARDVVVVRQCEGREAHFLGMEREVMRCIAAVRDERMDVQVNDVHISVSFLVPLSSSSA